MGAMTRRSCMMAALLLGNVGVEAFHLNPMARSSAVPARSSSRQSHTKTFTMAAGGGCDGSRGSQSLQTKAVSAAAALLLALSPLSAVAVDTSAVAQASELSPVQMLVQKTTQAQKERLKAEEQKELQGDAKLQEGELIARVVVSIKADLYELGAPDVTGFPALNTDEARLIIVAFGKDGPPVAARRLTVKGRDFPVTVELTSEDLGFPLTKDAWKTDARNKEDIGLAVEIDPDGKLATLDEQSLTGYGVSKPLRIGAQMERTEATVELLPNPGLKEKAEQGMPSDELAQLDRIDAMLDFKDSNQAAKPTAGVFSSSKRKK